MQPVKKSSHTGGTESEVAPQASSSSTHDARPWPKILSFAGPTPRDLLDIYYARSSNHTVDVGKVAPSVESTRLIRSLSQHHDNLHLTNSGSVMKEDHLVLQSLATGTIDLASLIRRLPHSQEKRSQGVMRNQAAGVSSDRHRPYKIIMNMQTFSVVHPERHHSRKSILPSTENNTTGKAPGYNIPVEHMPLSAPSPNEDVRYFVNFYLSISWH
uniref:Uncharacterized protein n=1 Tax=Psilocybe cubensis TaxID=181762 RepID=A0A8H7XWZ3_PSICU